MSLDSTSPQAVQSTQRGLSVADWVTQMPQHRTAEPSTGRALRALTHPAVPLLLLVWILNDHVFKAQFHNAVTGKLSDVVAMVVFPLLIAAVVERWSNRPLAIGLAVNTIFFSAINLFATADALTEAAMSLIIETRLTPDPTDLLVLPAMAGAIAVWQRTPTSRAQLRRRVGGIVLGVGCLACIATSTSEQRSEQFDGTVLLTEEQPSVTFPIALTIDGENVNAQEVSLSRSVRVFGDQGEEPSGSAFVTSSIEATEPGQGLVTLSLNDLAAAPTQVDWSLVAVTFGGDGVFFGSDAPEPVLTVQAPPNEFGPEPFVTVPTGERQRDAIAPRVRLIELQIKASNQSDLRMRVPPLNLVDQPRLATSDEFLTVLPGELQAIPIPDDCAARCNFSVWIGMPVDHIPAAGYEIEFYDVAATSTASIVEHTPHLTTAVSAESESFRFVEHREQKTMPSAVDSPLDFEDPVVAATSFVVLTDTVTSDPPTTQVHFFYVRLRRAIPAQNCCPSTAVLEASILSSDDASVEASVALQVDLYTLEPVPADALQVRLGS